MDRQFGLANMEFHGLETAAANLGIGYAYQLSDDLEIFSNAAVAMGREHNLLDSDNEQIGKLNLENAAFFTVGVTWGIQ